MAQEETPLRQLPQGCGSYWCWVTIQSKMPFSPL